MPVFSLLPLFFLFLPWQCSPFPSPPWLAFLCSNTPLEKQPHPPQPLFQAPFLNRSRWSQFRLLCASTYIYVPWVRRKYGIRPSRTEAIGVQSQVCYPCPPTGLDGNRRRLGIKDSRRTRKLLPQVRHDLYGLIRAHFPERESPYAFPHPVHSFRL